MEGDGACRSGRSHRSGWAGGMTPLNRTWLYNWDEPWGMQAPSGAMRVQLIKWNPHVNTPRNRCTGDDLSQPRPAGRGCRRVTPYLPSPTYTWEMAIFPRAGVYGSPCTSACSTKNHSPNGTDPADSDARLVNSASGDRAA